MKFSVLLPTCNRLDLLTMAIETVLQQDYDDWEVIVSDNFSEENIAGYIDSLNDARVKYFRTEKFLPVTDNWNNAIDQSTGDYVIMLGDDDGLMPGYFSILNDHIETYAEPDFIYTGAYLFAYPGVLPGCPGGFVRSYENRAIYQGRGDAFLLEKNTAIAFVESSMNFHVAFDYNMQFSLVSRKLIEALKEYGPFYQSPYPDYYASNVIMLSAQRILVVPKPLVAVGISPKSFGSYYFNDAESKGNKFLNNLPDKEMGARLRKVMLPGSTMNTSWLIAMETIVENCGRKYDVSVNFDRYRIVQILSVFTAMLLDKANSRDDYNELIRKMRPGEWIRLWVPFVLQRWRTPRQSYPQLAQKWQQMAASHPAVDMPELVGTWATMLELFENTPEWRTR